MLEADDRHCNLFSKSPSTVSISNESFPQTVRPSCRNWKVLCLAGWGYSSVWINKGQGCPSQLSRDAETMPLRGSGTELWASHFKTRTFSGSSEKQGTLIVKAGLNRLRGLLVTLDLTSYWAHRGGPGLRVCQNAETLSFQQPQNQGWSSDETFSSLACSWHS